MMDRLKITGAVLAAGLIPGAIRGITEAILLYRGYPCPHGAASFSWLLLQCTITYSIAIACSGIVLGFLFFLGGLFRNRPMYAVLTGVTVAMILIDIVGWSTPIFDDTHSFHIEATIEPGSAAPDLLLISLDTCRADHLSAYGYPTAYLPHMDRIFRRGALCVDTVSGIPVTSPAHASIFTGRNPPGHESRFNAVPIARNVPTLTDVLADRGYATAAFVSAFPVIHEVSGLGRSFTLYDQLFTPRKLEPLFYRSTLIRPLTQYGRFRPAERSAGDTLNSVLSWWNRTPDSPRFTWVHFYDPHAPYTPPAPFDRLYEGATASVDPSIEAIVAMNAPGKRPDPETVKTLTARYDGEIAAVDHALGKMLDVLEATGRLDNTLIVLTADHGESLDEHGYYFSHGDHIFDPSVRVPLGFACPTLIPAGTLVAGQTGLIDIFSTTLDLLGMTPPDLTTDGRNLRSHLLDGKPVPDTDYYCESGAGVYTFAHSPSNERIRAKERAIRTTGEKLILSPDTGGRYFDLTVDPGENEPVTEPGFERSSRLLRRLSNYIRITDPPDRQPPRLPDPDSIEQLRALGYVDGP